MGRLQKLKRWAHKNKVKVRNLVDGVLFGGGLISAVWGTYSLIIGSLADHPPLMIAGGLLLFFGGFWIRRSLHPWRD